MATIICGLLVTFAAFLSIVRYLDEYKDISQRKRKAKALTYGSNPVSPKNHFSTEQSLNNRIN